MAGQPLNLRTIYVVDTSYLLELFKVDGNYSDDSAEEIKKRFQKAAEAGDLFIVPLPCLYELGNHIADVRDGGRRRDIAHKVLPVIKQCVKENRPWTIVPSTDIGSLSILWEQFTTTYIYYTKSDDSASIGLVDSSLIFEAQRLKIEYKKKISKVHIWTRDSALKSHEPDSETNPFVN